MWEPYKKGFKAYLQLERSLSPNSIEAYLSDIEKLTTFLLSTELKTAKVVISLYLFWMKGGMKFFQGFS